jgi:hypothetical protein
VLIEHPRLERQLVSLERKVTRDGRDTIDHIRGGHDDIVNAVASACVLALEHGTAMPLRRLQAYAIGSSFDPLATAEENTVALMRKEARIGIYPVAKSFEPRILMCVFHALCVRSAADYQNR